MSVRHALLALLTEGPQFGLRLRQEFEARTGDVWPLNVGQVYTTLQRLEREDHIESDEEGSDGAHKRFRITESGHRELERWLRTPPDLDPPPRDELVIKVQVAAHMPGVDITEVLQVHRRHLIERMQTYTALKADSDPDDIGLGLVVDAELFRLEATVRWLDAAEVRLRRSPSATPPAPTAPPAAERTRVVGAVR